jgi:hypothetical protein
LKTIPIILFVVFFLSCNQHKEEENTNLIPFKNIPFALSENELGKLMHWSIDKRYKDGLLVTHYLKDTIWNHFIVIDNGVGDLHFKISSNSKIYTLQTLIDSNFGYDIKEIELLGANVKVFNKLEIDQMNWNPSNELLFFKNDGKYIVYKYNTHSNIDSLVPDSKFTKIKPNWYK